LENSIILIFTIDLNDIFEEEPVGELDWFGVDDPEI